jgi:hypothetical protein
VSHPLDQIRAWLRQRIAHLPKIQSCRINSDGAVVARAWLGTETLLYAFDEPPRVRDLRHILQENSRVGAASLFLPHAALTPAPNETVTPPEWLLALHDLGGGKCYAYRADSIGCQIDELHFAPQGRDQRKQTHYKENIPLIQLLFFRQRVQHQALRGDWLVANFGSEAFWKEADYVARRVDEEFKARAERADQARATYQYTYEYRQNFGTPNMNSGPQAGQPRPAFTRPKTKLELAADLLGLPSQPSCDEIKSAFRRRALEVHPDTSELPKAEAEAQFKALTDAYNLLRDQYHC